MKRELPSKNTIVKNVASKSNIACLGSILFLSQKELSIVGIWFVGCTGIVLEISAFKRDPLACGAYLSKRQFHQTLLVLKTAVRSFDTDTDNPY